MANGSKKRRRKPGTAELMVSNPIWRSMKAAPMEDGASTKLVIEARMALARITSGQTRAGDPDELAFATSIALILAEFNSDKPEHERVFAEDHVPDVILAQEALMHAQKRANAGSSYGFAGPELQAVQLALDLFEQQLLHWPHRNVMDAMRAAAHRIRNGQVMKLEWAPGAAPAA